MSKAYGLLVFLAASALALAGCTVTAGTAQEPQETVTPIQVAPVQVGSLSQTSEIFGTAAASEDVNVLPKMNGELVELKVQENDYVEKGSVIGRLDSETLNIQLEMERLALQQAELQYKNLHTSGASASQLEQAEISVKQAQLRVQLAETNASNAAITAPVSGCIINIAAEPGELISSAQPFARVIALDPIRITAGVNTNQMLALQNAEEVAIEVPDLGVTGTAKITSISTVADASGFYTLEAEMSNAEEKIKPGMLAKFLIDNTLVSDAMLVPTTALIERNGVSYIFVVKEGRAVQTEVTVEESQSEMTAVQGELTASDLVVTKGQYTLTDGSAIEVIEEAQ